MGGFGGLLGSQPQRTQFRRNVQRWTNNLLDLIFPPRCVHCNRVGNFLCDTCQQSIRPAPAANQLTGALAGRRATGLFEGAIQSAIHALKYKNGRRLAEVLAQRLAVELAAAAWSPTLLTAVPLHPDRLRERGYNQSELLGTHLSTLVRLPFRADLIARTRATRPQVGLNAQERKANMMDAFRAHREPVEGQAIVIIDDVYTTGATLAACAEALRQAGAAQVWALTLASAH